MYFSSLYSNCVSNVLATAHLIISCTHLVNDQHGLMNTPSNKGINVATPNGKILDKFSFMIIHFVFIGNIKFASQAGQCHGNKKQ